MADSIDIFTLVHVLGQTLLRALTACEPVQPTSFLMADINNTATVPAVDDAQVHRVVILGSGPSGLTAAIYSARAQLAPIVLHGEAPGGQLVTTTVIENFPGFVEPPDGQDLIDRMQKQAEHFGATFQYGSVQSVRRSGKVIELVLVDGKARETE